MLLTAQPLSGERLLLEPLQVEHAAEMAVVLADPALYEYTGGEPPSAADLIERYRKRGVGYFIAHIHPEHAASSAVAARLGLWRTGATKDGEVRWELATRCHN